MLSSFFAAPSFFDYKAECFEAESLKKGVCGSCCAF